MTNKNSNPFNRLNQYDRSHLAYHLYSAQQGGLLHSLLSTETLDRQNAWYAIKSHHDQVAGYLADLDLGRQLAERRVSSDGPSGLCRQIQYALMFASVRRLAQHFPARLMAMAVAVGEWSTSRAIDMARHIPNRSDVPEALAGIAVHLPPRERDTLCQEALDICSHIAIPVGSRHFEDRGPDDPRRAILTRLFPLLPETQIASGFAVIWSLPLFDRIMTIQAVRRYLQAPQRTIVLQWIADHIEYEYAAELIVAIADAVDPIVLDDYLTKISRQILYGTHETRSIVHYRLFPGILKTIVALLSPTSRRVICESFLDADLVTHVYQEETAARKGTQYRRFTRAEIADKLSGHIHQICCVVAPYAGELSPRHRQILLKRLAAHKDKSGYLTAVAAALPRSPAKLLEKQIQILSRGCKRTDSLDLANTVIHVSSSVPSPLRERLLRAGISGNAR
jgi:hypothetical protein